MHLPIKVIRQPPVVVQPTQIRAAHVADLEFLVAAGPGGIGEGAQFAFFFLLGSFGSADLVEFTDGGADGTGFAEDADFEEASVDGAGKVGDLFELGGERGGGVS